MQLIGNCFLWVGDVVHDLSIPTARDISFQLFFWDRGPVTISEFANQTAKGIVDVSTPNKPCLSEALVGVKMGSDTNSPSPSPSPSAKRSRDPEDDVYLDNLHSHKRYLSEIMASSLNGLTVGDPNSETIMESPARSETMFYTRDELPLQYSPMSEDFDDTRYCETPTHTSCSSQPDSRPTSPVSPYRYKSLSAFCCSPPPMTSHPSSSTSILPPSQPRHSQRGSDAEGRFPSSPSDICHSADLRRAALLRSVQMRAHLPGSSPFDLAFPSVQEPMHSVDQDQVEEQPCSYIKPLTDEQEDYQIDGCSSSGVSELDYEQKKPPCRDLQMDKVESSHD